MMQNIEITEDPAKNEIRPITWIASFPKSGNTWVRMLLAAYRFDAPLNINFNHEVTQMDVQKIALQSVSPIPVTELTDNQIVHLRHAALMKIMADFPHVPTLLKTHSANISVNGIEMIPPEFTKGAVYLVRDPRDVAISYAEHIGQPIDETIELMSQIGQTLKVGWSEEKAFLSTWNDHVTGWFDDADYPVLAVRYEDLLKNAAAHLGNILRHIGINVDRDRVNRAVDYCKFAGLKNQEVATGFREASEHTRFFKRGTAGGWRTVLTKDQVKRIERDHGDAMRRLGYLEEKAQIAV